MATSGMVYAYELVYNQTDGGAGGVGGDESDGNNNAQWMLMGQQPIADSTTTPVSSVSMSDDGTTIAVSFQDSKVRMYRYNDDDDDVTSSRWLPWGSDISVPQQPGRVPVALSNDGTKVALGGETGRVYQYDATDIWTQVGQDILVEANEQVSWIDISSDGTIILIGHPGRVSVHKNDPITRLWGQLGQDVERQRTYYDFSLSGDGKSFVLGDINDLLGKARVYEFVEEMEQWAQLGDDIDGPVNDILEFGNTNAISSNGKVIAAGSYGSLTPGPVFQYNATSAQ